MFKNLDKKLSAEWLFDKAWPIFWLFAGGFITSTYVIVTETIKSYGPLITIALPVLGAYAFLGFYFLLQLAIRAKIRNKFANTVTLNGEANPLESEFSKKIIRLNDFYDPFYFPHKNKSFYNCKIIGPGNILLLGGSMTSSSLSHCQIVIVKDEIPVAGVTVLETCTISNSQIVNCTLFMSRSVYNGIPNNLKNQIPVLNG